jgi:hypothetical protein
MTDCFNNHINVELSVHKGLPQASGFNVIVLDSFGRKVLNVKSQTAKLVSLPFVEDLHGLITLVPT